MTCQIPGEVTNMALPWIHLMALEEREGDSHLVKFSAETISDIILSLRDERRLCKILSLPNYIFLGCVNKQVSFLTVLACISWGLNKMVKLLYPADLFCRREKLIVSQRLNGQSKQETTVV